MTMLRRRDLLRSWLPLALACALWSFAAVAAEPKILLLVPEPTNTATPRPITVIAAPGIREAKAHPRSNRWTVQPGDVLRTSERPSPRVVGIYGGSGAEPTLLCRILVAYYPDPRGGWAPMFRLDEQPLVMRDGNGWKPLLQVQGVPTLIVQSGGKLPNVDGYAPTLEFGLTTGPMPIDAWGVE